MEKTFTLLMMYALLRTCLAGVALMSSAIWAAEPAKMEPETVSVRNFEHILKEAGVPSWIFAVNGEITVEADEVIFEENIFHNVKLPFVLTDTLVELSRANFTTLGGDFVIKLELPKQRNKFSAHVDFNNLVLLREEKPNAKKTSTTPELLFDNSRLIPDWLHHLNGSLVLAGKNVRLVQVKAHKLDAQIAFSNADVVTKFTTLTTDGSMHGKFSHAYETQQTSFNFQGRSVALSLLPASREYAENIAVDFKVDVTTHGSSPHEWVSVMNGKILAEFGEGKINVRKLDKLSQDILSLTLTSLLPISLGSTRSNFECGAVKLDITNGLARSENSIALRTENLAVMGGGKINFASEEVALTLHPHARRTGKLNAKSAIKEVTVTGPLTDLQVKPHLGGIINQGISLTTKIATLTLSKIGIPVLDWAAPADIACLKSLN